MRNPVAAGLLLSLCLMATPATQSTQTGELRLVSTAWSPFTNDPGQPRVALDLVESALERIGLSARTVIVDPAGFTSALLSGEFDGSAAAWKDAERERVLIFSQPYLENRLILVGRSGADVSAASLGQLAGKRVAVVEGYSYGDALDFSGATLVRSRSEEDSLALLLASKTDYTLMDELVVQYLVNTYPTEARTRLNLGSRALVTRPLLLRREASASRRRNDREALQRAAPRNDRRSYVSSCVACLVDLGGRRWGRRQRVRAGQRPVRHYGTAERLRAFEDNRPALDRSPRREVPLLRRREHLSGLGVGSEPIQGR